MIPAGGAVYASNGETRPSTEVGDGGVCDYGEVVGGSEDKKPGHGVPRARYDEPYAENQMVSKSDAVNVIESGLFQPRGIFQIPLQSSQI